VRLEWHVTHFDFEVLEEAAVDHRIRVRPYSQKIARSAISFPLKEINF
jgi:hypothetical protein